jgi:hypothetical protein
MQASSLGLLSERCAIQRQVFVDDQAGGQTPADPDNPWPTVAGQESAPCRVDVTRIRPKERFSDNRLTSAGDFDVSFEAGTDIRNKDRIAVTTLAGRVFNMVGPRYATDEILRVMAADEIV